mmetsp:Transcript_1197/g.4042  ORF Transcript_1197/g.4042 Transcript_1197/m.4042 type:complete len:208 (-) Transcript_1197:1181-1804(-)
MYEMLFFVVRRDEERRRLDPFSLVVAWRGVFRTVPEIALVVVDAEMGIADDVSAEVECVFSLGEGEGGLLGEEGGVVHEVGVVVDGSDGVYGVGEGGDEGLECDEGVGFSGALVCAGAEDHGVDEGGVGGCGEGVEVELRGVLPDLVDALDGVDDEVTLGDGDGLAGGGDQVGVVEGDAEGHGDGGLRGEDVLDEVAHVRRLPALAR